MNDIMIDCETLSTRFDAAVISIGAIKFNPHGDDTQEFERVFADRDLMDRSKYIHITLVPSPNAHIDPETIRWWFSKSPEALASVSNAIMSEASALEELESWIGSSRGNKIWAKSPSADCVWLKNLATRCGTNVPWDFTSERDVRTAQELARQVSGKSIKEWKIHGAHDALVDCALQIYQVQQSFRMLTA